MKTTQSKSKATKKTKSLPKSEAIEILYSAFSTKGSYSSTQLKKKMKTWKKDLQL